MPTLNIEVLAEDMADAIAKLDHAQIIELVLRVLEICAIAELDEELVARIWPTIQQAYSEADGPPSLEEVLQRYPAHA